MKHLALLLCVALLLTPAIGFTAEEDDNTAITEATTTEKEIVVDPPVEVLDNTEATTIEKEVVAGPPVEGPDNVETTVSEKEPVNRAAAIAEKVGDITGLSVFTSAGLPGAVIGAISISADALGFIFRQFGKSKKEPAQTQPVEKPIEIQN